MSATHAAGLIPCSPQRGVWVDSSSKTDPAFFCNLTASLLPKAARHGLMIIFDPAASSYAQNTGIEICAGPWQTEPSGIISRSGVSQQLFPSGTVVEVCKVHNTRFGWPTGQVIFANDISSGTLPTFAGAQIVQSSDFPVSITQPLQSRTSFEINTLRAAPTTVPSELYSSALQSVAEDAFRSLQLLNSTGPAEDLFAEEQFDALFRRAVSQRFEDGMESQFSRDLGSLIATYGAVAKGILSRLLVDESISARVWGEAMRSLGRIEDPSSREARLWVLEKGLTARSPIVRDGAALGLASMDDPSAIPYLQRAIDSEELSDLRADMRDVLSQLTNQ